VMLCSWLSKTFRSGWLWKWRRIGHLKHQELLAEQLGITSQKIWILIFVLLSELGSNSSRLWQYVAHHWEVTHFHSKYEWKKHLNRVYYWHWICDPSRIKVSFCVFLDAKKQW
jgi:hypothetical protein